MAPMRFPGSQPSPTPSGQVSLALWRPDSLPKVAHDPSNLENGNSVSLGYIGGSIKNARLVFRNGKKTLKIFVFASQGRGLTCAQD
jgi:hypothetical protein